MQRTIVSVSVKPVANPIPSRLGNAMDESDEPNDGIDLRFTGKLADANRMDFYEAARLQYATARLAVKLDRFRRYGKFPKKVTTASNTGIDLTPFDKGSFHIRFDAPINESSDNWFINVPLSALWAYVIERVFKPADDADIRRGLFWEDDLLDSYDSSIREAEDPARRTLNLVGNASASGRPLDEEAVQLANRLYSEAERRAYLTSISHLLAPISAEQDAKLVTMAAPLLKDFSLPFRRSAAYASLSIYGPGVPRRPILNIDKAMAAEVELSNIDQNVVPLRINIVQYDKESGWGKFRNPEFEGKSPFSVAADRKNDLQAAILRNMNKDEVLATVSYVRSLAGINKRLILFDLPEDQYYDL